MDENVKQAVAIATEVVKQLITLSTGVIALTITFLTDVAADAPSSARAALYSAWGAYTLSLALGIATLLAIAGTMEKAESPSIYSGNIRVLAAVQILAFLVALGCTFAFAVMALA